MYLAIQDVSEFHIRSKTPICTKPEFPSDERVALRDRLFVEEGIKEFLRALRARDMVLTADGIIDTIYVLIGCGLELGLPLDELWDEVQKKNLEKFVEVRDPSACWLHGPDHLRSHVPFSVTEIRSTCTCSITYEVYKDAGGKVTKPPEWTPPDIEGILRRHGWTPPEKTEDDAIAKQKEALAYDIKCVRMALNFPCPDDTAKAALARILSRIPECE